MPELATSVFIIPSVRMQNGEDRSVVLNQVARTVIEAVNTRSWFATTETAPR